MEKELKDRIEELKEFISAKWTTLDERDIAEEKLERLKLLYEDLTEFIQSRKITIIKSVIKEMKKETSKTYEYRNLRQRYVGESDEEARVRRMKKRLALLKK